MPGYDPIVPRPSDGANLPDSLRQARYQQMLSEELGRRPEGFVPDQPARNWRSLVLPILLMLLFAVMILGAAWLFLQWRSGEFRFTAPAAVATEAERAWRREDRARPVEDGPPMESEIEKMFEEQRKALDNNTMEDTVNATD